MATIVISVFLSGNAMFFVTEIFPDLLIVSHTELSMELFTKPITINITFLNLQSETDQTKKTGIILTSENKKTPILSVP